jgi:hypothetical protein
MQKVEWTPRLFLVACALAIGVVGQAAPDASSDATGDATTGPAADATTGSPDDAATTTDSCPTEDASPGANDDGPGPTTWPGPPSNDGALDDGYMVPFTLDNGNALAYLGISSAGLPAFTTYTTVKAPYTDATGCMAYDAQGHMAAHTCLCQKCFSLVQQCDALTACRAILKCAQDSGCNSANACYLYPGAPCINVINSAGTGSVSTGLESNIATCGMSNGCPSQ